MAELPSFPRTRPSSYRTTLVPIATLLEVRQTQRLLLALALLNAGLTLLLLVAR